VLSFSLGLEVVSKAQKAFHEVQTMAGGDVVLQVNNRSDTPGLQRSRLIKT